MLSDIYKICAIVIITIVLTGVLKAFGSGISKYVSQICAVCVLGAAILSIKPIISFISNLQSKINLSLDTPVFIMEIAVITLICGVISEICKENGENMLSDAVVFVGNCQIVLLSLPLLNNLLSILGDFLKI